MVRILQEPSGEWLASARPDTRARPAGVRRTGLLLRIATSRRGRRDLAKRTGIDEQQVLLWVKQADLARISGVDVVYSSLLVTAGVATVPDLARRNPARLYLKLADVSQAMDLVRKTPGENQVRSWVSQAKLLPRVITY